MVSQQGCHFATLQRRAFTLVELLVVLGIIVVLAAITLPTVKGLLEDQKISQAARVVQGYVESARARALASGRRVALILERMPYSSTGSAGTDLYITNSTCTRLSIGEVFPPYEGDWAGSVATLVDTNADGFADQVQFALAEAASMWDTSTSMPSTLVSIGDSIEFADRQQGFVITSNPVLTGLIISFNFANPPTCTYGPAIAERTWPMPVVPQVRFRIHRKPTKSMTGGITLPRGTCIDLAFSGTGTTGREFAPDQIQSTSTLTGDSYGPVFIVFGPRGTVEIAYYQTRTGVVPSVQQIYPTGIFHLLIGRSDQVPTPLPLRTSPQPPGNMLAPEGGFGVESERDDFKSNIMDPGNAWVSINPYSGAIYSSSVTGIVPPATGTFTVPFRTAQARQFATSVLNRGGS